MITMTAKIKKLALTTLLFSCLMVLLAACSGFSGGKTINTHTGPTTILCPAVGTARAAVIPPLPTGSHPALVYTESDANSYSILQRYDTITHTTLNIASTPNAAITSAQVSPDGQWILFSMRVSSSHQHIELRLVRVDGQYQQTLFCLPMPAGMNNYASEMGNFQWSPDETTVAITGFAGQYDLPAIYMVDLTQGQVQLVLESTVGPVIKSSNNAYPQYMEIYAPAKWLDSTHLYVWGSRQQSSQLEPEQSTIYLLDTSKGANQHNSDLQKIFSRPVPANGSNLCDFDSSSDGPQLFVLTCTDSNGYYGAPGTITVQPANGDIPRIIISSKTLPITSVRAINASTLLLLVNGFPNTTSQNGIWKINTDGTGLTRLASYNNPSFCGVSYTPCSSVSLDGSLYAMVKFSATGADTLNYGPLNGGLLKQAVQLSGLYSYYVGWARV